NGTDVEIYKKISEFNPFADKSCSWFDPWWMFGVKEGFDIVIVNPPYVVPSLTKNEKDNFKKQYKSALYQINLYLLFVEKGSLMLKKDGVLSFIIPNTWLVNKAVSEFRKFLLEELNILKIVDLTFEKIFEATVLPIILFVSKNNKTQKDNLPVLKIENGIFNLFNEISKTEILNDENFLINYQINKESKKLFDKIELNTSKLKDIAKVSFGIKLYEVGQGKPMQTKETVLK
ncbi:MAG: Eco57I restriction-modification methylase domain-containing protein, partial [Patescibacteria group bacterium]